METSVAETEPVADDSHDLDAFDTVAQVASILQSKGVSDVQAEATIATIRSSSALADTVRNASRFPLLEKFAEAEGSNSEDLDKTANLTDKQRDTRLLESIFKNKTAQQLIQAVWGKNTAEETDVVIRQIEKESLTVLELLHQRMNKSVKEWLKYLGEPNPDLRTNLSHTAFWAIALAGQMRNFENAAKHFWDIRLRRGREVGVFIPDQRLLSEGASFSMWTIFGKEDGEALKNASQTERQVCLIYKEAEIFFQNHEAAETLDCTLLLPSEGFEVGQVAKIKLKREWFSSSGAGTLPALKKVIEESGSESGRGLRVTRADMEYLRNKVYGDYKTYKADPLVGKVFGSERASEHLIFVLASPGKGQADLGRVSSNPWFMTGGDSAYQVSMIGDDSIYTKSAHRYSDGVETKQTRENPFKFDEVLAKLAASDKESGDDLVKEMQLKWVGLDEDEHVDSKPKLPTPEIFSEAVMGEGGYTKLSELVSRVRELYTVSLNDAKNTSITAVDLMQFAFHLMGNEAGQIVVQQKDGKKSLLNVGFSVVPQRVMRGKELLDGKLDAKELDQLADDLLKGMRLFIQEKKWAIEGKGTGPFFTTLAGQVPQLENLFAAVGKQTAGRRFINGLCGQSFMHSMLSRGQGPEKVSKSSRVIDFFSAQTQTLSLKGDRAKAGAWGLGAIGIVDSADGGLSLSARTMLDQAWPSIQKSLERFIGDAKKRELYEKVLFQLVFDGKGQLIQGIPDSDTEEWGALLANISMQIERDRQQQLQSVIDVLPKICDLLIDYAQKQGATPEKKIEAGASKGPEKLVRSENPTPLKRIIQKIVKRW